MTASIITMRRAPAPVQKPAPQPTHTTFTPEARMAFDSLKGRVNALDRVFSGPSAPIGVAARIERILADIDADVKRVRRAVK